MRLTAPIPALLRSAQPTPRRTTAIQYAATRLCCRILEDDADVDDDVARLLEGTDGDPDLIREKVRTPASPLQRVTQQSCAPCSSLLKQPQDISTTRVATQGLCALCLQMKAELSRSDMFMDGLGSERPPRVRFRQYNPFALWVSALAQSTDTHHTLP